MFMFPVEKGGGGNALAEESERVDVEDATVTRSDCSDRDAETGPRPSHSITPLSCKAQEYGYGSNTHQSGYVFDIFLTLSPYTGPFPSPPYSPQDCQCYFVPSVYLRVFYPARAYSPYLARLQSSWSSVLTVGLLRYLLSLLHPSRLLYYLFFTFLTIIRLYFSCLVSYLNTIHISHLVVDEYLSRLPYPPHRVKTLPYRFPRVLLLSVAPSPLISTSVRPHTALSALTIQLFVKSP